MDLYVRSLNSEYILQNNGYPPRQYSEYKTESPRLLYCVWEASFNFLSVNNDPGIFSLSCSLS